MFVLKKIINNNHQSVGQDLPQRKMSSGWPVEFDVEIASSYLNPNPMTLLCHAVRLNLV